MILCFKQKKNGDFRKIFEDLDADCKSFISYLFSFINLFSGINLKLKQKKSMIHTYVIISIAVLLSVMILVMIGQKLKVAYPIFLVIAGLIISLVPGMPHIEIEPDLIFLIFLPPILFEAAWFTS